MAERFICLGDSITEGIGDQKKIGWPGRLSQLIENTYPDRWHIHNLGIAGDTTSDISHRFFSEVLYRRPQRLVICAGVNNSVEILRPNSSGTKLSKEYTKSLWEGLADEITKSKISTVLLGLPPVNEELFPLIYKPYDKEDKGIRLFNAEIKKREDIIFSICREKSLEFIPLHENLLKTDYVAHLSDGLHPDANGYDILAEFLFNEFKKIQFL